MESFSDVILKYYPKRPKLFEIFGEVGYDPELADAIEAGLEPHRMGKKEG